MKLRRGEELSRVCVCVRLAVPTTDNNKPACGAGNIEITPMLQVKRHPRVSWPPWKDTQYADPQNPNGSQTLSVCV